jgi:O-antigen/teichoic acid export membrane protein
MALVWVAVLLAYDLPGAAGLLPLGAQAPRWQRGRLQRLALIGAPLGLVMLLVSLNGNVPRYFVERHLGESALGAFGALFYVTVAGHMVVTALGQIVAPRLARLDVAGDARAFRRLLGGSLWAACGVGAACVLVAWLGGGRLLTLLYAAEYASYAKLFVWLMLAAAPNYLATILGVAATATRRLRYQPVALAAVVLATTLACWVLIPREGLAGAAIAVAVGSLVMAATHGLLLLGPRDSARAATGAGRA